MKFFNSKAGKVDGDSVPNELWLLIFEYLDTESLRNIRATSSRFRVLGDILWKKFVKENIASDETFWSLKIQRKKQQNSAYVDDQIYFETLQANIKLIKDIENKLDLPSHNLFASVKNFFKNIFKENQFKSKEEAIFAILQNGFDVLWQKYLDKHDFSLAFETWEKQFTKMLDTIIVSNNPTCIKKFFKYLNDFFQNEKKNSFNMFTEFFICQGRLILHKPLFTAIEKLIEDANSIDEMVKTLISFCVYPIDYTPKKHFLSLANGTIQDFPLDYPTNEFIIDKLSEETVRKFRGHLYELKYSCLGKCITKNKIVLAEYFLEFSELSRDQFIAWCIDRAFEENKVALFIFLIKKADKLTVEIKTEKAQDENKDEIFKELIKNGLVDVNKKDHKEQTLLHKAVIKSDFDMVKLLCENGAHIDVEDNLHWTPADHAFEKENIKILSYLLGKYPNLVNKPNIDGKTFLHRAVENALITGHKQVIQLLLEHNASTKIKDEDGKTPLDYIEDKSTSTAQLFAEENKAEEKPGFLPKLTIFT